MIPEEYLTTHRLSCGFDFSEDVCAVHQRVGVGMHFCARVGESPTGTGETFDALAIYSE